MNSLGSIFGCDPEIVNAIQVSISAELFHARLLLASFTTLAYTRMYVDFRTDRFCGQL